MVTKSLNMPAPKADPVPLAGREEWVKERMIYTPSCVPNLLDIDSLTKNRTEVRNIINKKIKEGLLIDEIVFLTIPEDEGAARLSPELRQRMEKGGYLGYDFATFVFDKFFVNKENSQKFRVMGKDRNDGNDNGVKIRVNEKEMTTIIKDGGRGFMRPQHKKRIDEYHIVIPYSNIVKIIFIRKKKKTSY